MFSVGYNSVIMIQIDFTGDSRYPVDKKRIRASIKDVLKKEGLSENVEVGVSVVGSRKMKQLNTDYREKPYATNVLSFCAQEMAEDSEGFVQGPEGSLHLGDMVICYPVARKEAGEYMMLVDDWVDELVRHSMEHLLGRHHL